MKIIDLHLALDLFRDYLRNNNLNLNTTFIESIRKAYDGIIFETSDHKFLKYWYDDNIVTELKDWKEAIRRNKNES